MFYLFYCYLINFAACLYDVNAPCATINDLVRTLENDRSVVHVKVSNNRFILCSLVFVVCYVVFMNVSKVPIYQELKEFL